jgi:hypothetical protein
MAVGIGSWCRWTPNVDRLDIVHVNVLKRRYCRSVSLRDRAVGFAEAPAVPGLHPLGFHP